MIKIVLIICLIIAMISTILILTGLFGDVETLIMAGAIGYIIALLLSMFDIILVVLKYL